MNRNRGHSSKKTYLNDYVAHAPIEPHAAVVNIEGKQSHGVGINADPFRAKEEIAKELGIPPEECAGHAGLLLAEGLAGRAEIFKLWKLLVVQNYAGNRFRLPGAKGRIFL